MKTWKVEAAIIAVGMVLLGVIIKWGINDFVDKERIVSVKGLADKVAMSGMNFHCIKSRLTGQILAVWEKVRGFLSSPWFYAGIGLLVGLLVLYIILNIVHNRNRRKNNMQKVKKYK